MKVETSVFMGLGLIPTDQPVDPRAVDWTGPNGNTALGLDYMNLRSQEVTPMTVSMTSKYPEVSDNRTKKKGPRW